ncbi:MAG: MFS transporter [Candidatus Binatia bacterium]
MAAPSPARSERNVIILTGVGHFSTHFFELMFPTLAVALALQANLPLDQVLGWSFLGYLLFGLGALPAGLVADRVGARLLLLISLFGLGVAALAASEVSSPRALTICLAAMGACASIYHPVGMSLITRGVSSPGRALGVNGIFGNVAIATTPMITAALCAALGWQNAYRAVGYAMCAVAVSCAFLPIAEPAVARARAERADAGAIAWRPLAVLFVAAVLAGMTYRGSTLIQPGYFAANVTELGYGAATSLAYMFGIVGQYFGGVAADRYDRRRMYLLFHALSLPVLLAMSALGGLPLVACGALFAFFSLGMQPIENSLFAQFTPPRWRSTIYGVKFAGTFGIGSLAVWLVRWADGAAGLSYAILCLAALVVLIVAAALLLVRIGSGAAPSPALIGATLAAPRALYARGERADDGRGT